MPLSSRPSGRERSEEGGGGGGEAEGRGEAAGGREEDAGQEEEDQLGSYGPPPHKEEGPAAARPAALIHRRRRLPVVLALRFVAASAAGGEQGTGRERCVRPADKTTGGCLVTAFGTAFGRAFHCLWSSISLPLVEHFTALPLSFLHCPPTKHSPSTAPGASTGPAAPANAVDVSGRAFAARGGGRAPAGRVLVGQGGGVAEGEAAGRRDGGAAVRPAPCPLTCQRPFITALSFDLPLSSFTAFHRPATVFFVVLCCAVQLRPWGGCPARTQRTGAAGGGHPAGGGAPEVRARSHHHSPCSKSWTALGRGGPDHLGVWVGFGLAQQLGVLRARAAARRDAAVEGGAAVRAPALC